MEPKRGFAARSKVGTIAPSLSYNPVLKVSPLSNVDRVKHIDVFFRISLRSRTESKSRALCTTFSVYCTIFATATFPERGNLVIGLIW